MTHSVPACAATWPLAQAREEAHPFCFVCSPSNPRGLGVRFAAAPHGTVEGTFPGDPATQGDEGIMHGGLVATLLDGAMTHCLFANGVSGLTAELLVRYRSPILAATPTSVRAWLDDSQHGLFRLRAELAQDGKIKARAHGKSLQPASCSSFQGSVGFPSNPQPQVPIP